MKLTKKYLKRIIKEETAKVVREMDIGAEPALPGMGGLNIHKLVKRLPEYMAYHGTDSDKMREYWGAMDRWVNNHPNGPEGGITELAGVVADLMKPQPGGGVYMDQNMAQNIADWAAQSGYPGAKEWADSMGAKKGYGRGLAKAIPRPGASGY